NSRAIGSPASATTDVVSTRLVPELNTVPMSAMSMSGNATPQNKPCLSRKNRRNAISTTARNPRTMQPSLQARRRPSLPQPAARQRQEHVLQVRRLHPQRAVANAPGFAGFQQGVDGFFKVVGVDHRLVFV